MEADTQVMVTIDNGGGQVPTMRSGKLIFSYQGGESENLRLTNTSGGETIVPAHRIVLVEEQS